MQGFVDLQVNGFRGVNFSAPGLTLQQVRDVVDDLRRKGTIAFCPTVITSPWEIYEQNLPILARAMEDKDLAPFLLGVHLEGPFISPEDGALGAHQRSCVLSPSVDVYKRLRDLASDWISLVTLAPEQPGAIDLIRYLRANGATVALGHHLARERDIVNACEAGAQGVTHLGNGIPANLPRHPNPLWDQLDEDRLWAMLITDGCHLPATFVRIVLRIKSVSRVIIVSDGAPIAGLPPGNYSTAGQEIVLEESGRIWNPNGKHLVGSSACMLDCINWLASVTSLTVRELVQVGLENPLEFLGKTISIGLLAGPELSFVDHRFSFEAAS